MVVTVADDPMRKEHHETYKMNGVRIYEYWFQDR